MRKYRVNMLARVAVTLVLGASTVTASTINLGTGQSPGVINTASDPIWNIVNAPTGNTSGPAVLIGSPIWGAAPAGLHWISSDPATPGGNQYAAGNYDYRTTFSDTGQLTFSLKADNAVTVYLDSVAIYDWGDATGSNSSGWATFSPTQIVNIASPSTHSLDLVVHNNGLYSGVVLQGDFTTAAPEPGTYALLISGFGLIAAGRWLIRAKLRKTVNV